MVPQTTVDLARQATPSRCCKLLEALEDHDDVQNVSSNIDIPQEELERLIARERPAARGRGAEVERAR